MFGTWETAILRAVKKHGGTASLQDIYSTRPQLMPLTKSHVRPTKWGGRPAFQHAVRSYVSHLVVWDISPGRSEATTRSPRVPSPNYADPIAVW